MLIGKLQRQRKTEQQKELRTMKTRENEQVVKLDENGGRKDDEWVWVSLLNGPRETGSSTVIAFWKGRQFIMK